MTPPYIPAPRMIVTRQKPTNPAWRPVTHTRNRGVSARKNASTEWHAELDITLPGGGSGSGRFRCGFLQIITPMADEEFLLSRQEGFSGADDRPKGRGHLHNDQHENNDPRVQSRRRPRARMRKTILQKTQPEKCRDK